MFNIDKYLTAVERTLNAYRDNSQHILDIITRHTGIQLEKGDISIKNNCLYIDAKPFIKNKLFLYKEPILSSLEKEVKEKIIDIR